MRAGNPSTRRCLFRLSAIRHARVVPGIKFLGRNTDEMDMIRPLRRHSCVRISASVLAMMLGMLLHVASAEALIISEVMANPVGGFGSDDGLEWIELYNDGATTLTDLIGFTLGWGGANYADGTLDLALVDVATLTGGAGLAPGAYIRFGQTGSGVDFDPDLDDGFFTAAGVALFDVPVGQIPTNDPVDAVVYATFFGFNFDGLVDESGAVKTVDATTGGSGESIVRTTLAGGWTASATPTPGTGTLIPEPSTALLTLVGLLALGLRRHR